MKVLRLLTYSDNVILPTTGPLNILSGLGVVRQKRGLTVLGLVNLQSIVQCAYSVLTS